MMKEDWKFANSFEMDKRTIQAKDFYNKVLDEEEHPMFCSDEACFLDLYFGSIEESKEIIYKQYGVHLKHEHLEMPFWQLLDFLYSKK